MSIVLTFSHSLSCSYAFQNDVKMVKLLLHSRYEPETDTQPWNSRFLTFIKTTSADLTLSDNQGWNVIHHLIGSSSDGQDMGRDVILRLLAKVGVPLESTDNQGKTPLQLASPPMAEILQELITAEGAANNKRPTSASPPLSVSPPIQAPVSEPLLQVPSEEPQPLHTVPEPVLSPLPSATVIPTLPSEPVPPVAPVKEVEPIIEPAPTGLEPITAVPAVNAVLPEAEIPEQIKSISVVAPVSTPIVTTNGK